MSVDGFNTGNDNCIIAIVKQCGIDMLLNNESNCETPSVASFGEKQRFLGTGGAASAAMNTKSTISQVKHLICHTFHHPGIQEDLRRLPFTTSEAADGGILIHIRYMNEDRVFTPGADPGDASLPFEEIVEKNLQSSITDYVIGIPSYFTNS